MPAAAMRLVAVGFAAGPKLNVLTRSARQSTEATYLGEKGHFSSVLTNNYGHQMAAVGSVAQPAPVRHLGF